MATRLVPKNDAETNVLAYRAYEEPLAEVLRRYSDRTLRGMLTRIANVLNAAGYDGDRLAVIDRAADPATLRMLEELIERMPERERRRARSRIWGDIGTGSLTVRRAVRDIISFGRYEHTLDLYKASKRILGDVAAEGMMRGEYMVQKQVGISWKTDVPGTRMVDAFLGKRWTYNDVVTYMLPMEKMVRQQVAEAFLMGESVPKMAHRWEEAGRINRVRAVREARTTVTAVANQAHMESYKRHGVKRFEYVATFDERTCPVCGALDGRTFPLSSKEVGTNYPPIHPNCRCTTVAALSKELKDELYSDFEVHLKDGTAHRIDARITYDEWAREQGMA